MKTSYTYEFEGWEYDEQPIDLKLNLAVELSPYDSGCTYGPPELCYPPEGGEIEDMEITVESATYPDGLPVEAELIPLIEARLQAQYDEDKALQTQIDAYVYDQPPPERDYD
jgi:hypothetical protein